MSIKLTTIALLIAAGTPAQAGEFIRQTQLSSGLVWDFHPGSKQGSTWSPIAVDKGGSRFSLYTAGNKNNTGIFKLDESTIGTAFPTVELTIRSQDPHVPARTRADQPYSVTVKRHGTFNKVVSLKHSLETYNTKTHAASARPAVQCSWWQLPIQSQQNARFFPSIPSTNPTQAEGEEAFTAFATGSDGKKLHPLKSASIQVWPVASAKISGLAADTSVKSPKRLNKVSVQCEDLYPDSVTYVQIYRGNARLGTLGRIMPQTVIRFDTEVPQSQKIPLGDWASTLADGTYTLEVLHITPFNERKPERLAHISFVIDRGMHAPGLVKN